MWGGLDHFCWGYGGARFPKSGIQDFGNYGKGCRTKNLQAGIPSQRRSFGKPRTPRQTHPNPTPPIPRAYGGNHPSHCSAPTPPPILVCSHPPTTHPSTHHVFAYMYIYMLTPPTSTCIFTLGHLNASECDWQSVMQLQQFSALATETVCVWQYSESCYYLLKLLRDI